MCVSRAHNIVATSSIYKYHKLFSHLLESFNLIPEIVHYHTMVSRLEILVWTCFDSCNTLTKLMYEPVSVDVMIPLSTASICWFMHVYCSLKTCKKLTSREGLPRWKCRLFHFIRSFEFDWDRWWAAATAGVSRRIKIFDFTRYLRDQLRMHLYFYLPVLIGCVGPLQLLL